jgi:hypothetical protein
MFNFMHWTLPGESPKTKLLYGSSEPLSFEEVQNFGDICLVAVKLQMEIIQREWDCSKLDHNHSLCFGGISNWISV